MPPNKSMERKIDLVLRLATPVLGPAQFPLISDVRRRLEIFVEPTQELDSTIGNRT